MVKSLPKSLFTNITGLSHEGRGVATVNGKVTFLFGGLPTEEVEFNYLKTHGQYDEGKVTQVVKSAPTRVEPICPHFGTCGGCRLQHFEPTAQLLFKQDVLLEQLQHIGGVQPTAILPPLSSPTTGYRYKARLGVKYVRAKQKVLVGFHEIDGRYLANLNSCAVLHPMLGEKITVLSDFIQGLEAYQSIPQIEVAIGDTDTSSLDNDITAALVFRHLQPLSATDLSKLTTFGQTHRFSIYLQPGGIATIHKLWPIDNNPLLSYSLPEHQVQVNFHPSDFTQVNPYINRQMVNQAIHLLAPKPHERLLDLFCGLGNFTLPLARQCKTIIGVEGETKLVARAQANALHNHISNAHFYTADLNKELSQQPWTQTSYDKILLDPPRTGALEIVKILPSLKATTILYVSCNPATLARDAKELVQRGYQLTHAGVMDMFPHTSHVESIALFTYNN